MTDHTLPDPRVVPFVVLAPGPAPPRHQGPVAGVPRRRPGSLLVGAAIGVLALLWLALQSAGLAPAAGWIGRPNTAAVTPASLTAQELEAVLSYASNLRADDPLVQMRPGVFAKRSNVDGVTIDGRTLYYDIVPHQSFGPLQRGALSESDVVILSRQPAAGGLILIYVRK